MKDHASNDIVDAVLYDNDPLMGLGGLFERMTPSRDRLRTGRRYDVPLRGGVACP